MTGKPYRNRDPIRTLPVAVFLAAERGNTSVGPLVVVRSVIRGMDDNRVLGDAQVVQLFQECSDHVVIFHHTVGIKVSLGTGDAFILGTDVRVEMHP